MSTSKLYLDKWLDEEEAPFKKIIVSIGLILLVAGVAIYVFPTQETYSTRETVPVDSSPLWQHRTLEPQDNTFYGKYMERGMLFRLNISSSDSVKVTVSVVQQIVGGPSKVPIFGPSTGSSFNQQVSIPITGTYWVDIVNENSFSVTLDGNVLVQREQTRTNYRTVYPYAIPGFLILLGGTSALIFGIFKRSKRLPKFKRMQEKEK